MQSLSPSKENERSIAPEKIDLMSRDVSQEVGTCDKSEQILQGRFSSKYFGVTKIPKGWKAGLAGQVLGVFGSEYEAADHVDFWLDMFGIDSGLRNRTECTKTLRKMKVTNGRGLWKETLNRCKNNWNKPLSRIAGQVLPWIENTLCTKYQIPWSAKDFLNSSTCGGPGESNHSAKPLSDEHSSEMQLLAAKNILSILSFSAKASSILPCRAESNRDTPEHHSVTSNITSKTGSPSVTMESVENYPAEKTWPKKNNLLESTATIEDAVETLQQKKTRMHSDDIKKQKLSGNFNNNELKISDHINNNKRKLSCNPKGNKKEIITGNHPLQCTFKRRRLNGKTEMDITHGKHISKHEIKAGPDHLDVAKDDKQSNHNELLIGRKLNEIKPEQNKKRRRRRKSPSSPYQLGSSRYYGVCRHKKGVKKKWVAKCGNKYIGYFSTEDEAAFAVDRRLDEMGIDRRFRNKGGSEEAIKIMKGNRRSNWNRLLAIKTEISQPKDFGVNMSQLLIPGTAIKFEPHRYFNKIMHFGKPKSNIGNDYSIPSGLSNLLQIEPTGSVMPQIKSEYPDRAELEITESSVPIPTLAVRSKAQKATLSICNGESVDLCTSEPRQSQQLNVKSSNFQNEQVLDQHVPHMANPVRMLQLWKSRGALSEQQYSTASNMLDGRYGEVNAWSAKGLLDVGDIERLKTKLNEVQ